MISATNDAVYANITLIEQRLRRALAQAVEAREAMVERKLNLAIGTLLPMQEDVTDVDALLKTILVLHRHSSRPQHGGAA
jgi:hypothetical protein